MPRPVLIAMLLALAVPAAQAAELYDGSSLPGNQGWLAYMPGSVQTLGSGYVNLDTTGSLALKAGYGRVEPGLDSSSGFRLDFTAQLVTEHHGANANRAGFSVIVTDANKNGIELGFWDDAIWAQNLGFTHGSEIAFDTTGLTHYSLTVIGHTYTLTASSGGTSKTLSGNTVFYDADGLPAPFQNFPYRTANVLFFGDDTTSASGSFNLYSVSLAPVPEASSMTLMLSGLLGLAGLSAYRKRLKQ